MTNVRALVVDDSSLFRRFVRDALDHMPSVEVVGHAPNGKLALHRIRQLRPDAVILDIRMPDVDGLELLQLSQSDPERPAIVVLTRIADARPAAMQLGAFDFLIKPEGDDRSANQRALVDLLARPLGAISRNLSPDSHWEPPVESLAEAKLAAPPRVQPGAPVGIVAIASSTGGPDALNRLLPRLPADFPVPIVLVQHIGASFTPDLARGLNDLSAVRVCEAEHGQTLQPGTVYVAPGGRHLLVSGPRSRLSIAVSDGPPVNACRPSADVLFRSVADVFHEAALGLVMTGMGSDGTEGSRRIHDRGGSVMTQDEESCVVYGMPRCVVAAGYSDEVCSLSAMAERLIEITQQGAAV